MGGMGGEREKPLYPSLMDVPKMTPAKRAEVEKAAHERMRQSLARISSTTVRLADASSRNDDAAMQEATADLREATAQFESGVAASRALKEGRDPQSVALQWFKREMNLLPPMDAETAHNELGLPSRWFHYLTIAFLGSIVVVMIGMYFFKMRRASMLFGRIEADKGGSPPGSAPELAGGKPPSEDKPDAPADKPAAMPPIVSEMESPPPLTANWRGQLRVGSIVTETPSVKTLRLLPLFGERLPFTFIPG